MHNSQILYVVLFGLLAGVIAFRLYSVLGRRTGNERSHDDQLRLPDGARSNPRAPLAKDTVAPMPERSGGSTVSQVGPLARAILAIKFADATHFRRRAFPAWRARCLRNDRHRLRPWRTRHLASAPK